MTIRPNITRKQVAALELLEDKKRLEVLKAQFPNHPAFHARANKILAIINRSLSKNK